MVDSRESANEGKELRTTIQETASNVYQIRQRAEQEVRQANKGLEQRTRELGQALVTMRATLESTTDAILVTDEKFKVTEFNEKYLAMWKIPRELLESGALSEVREISSQSFTDPRRFISRIEEIIATGEESFDLLKLKDGRILERHSKVLVVEGQRAGRVWSFRDVTERHLAEITSRRLAAIVTSSDDAIIGKDLNSIITSWNFGAERIFGYTADEMIGTSIVRLIPPDRQGEEREILSRLGRGERVDHFETIRLAKDGRKLNVSITVSPINDSTGRVIGASKVARDITAWKKALEDAEAARSQAERASRMKDEFLATLSHELRTPLNAVLGWANILRHGKLQGEELKQGLDIIERNARAQSQLIEELLDMSRIISGRVRLDLQEVDLPSILNASIETLRATAEAKGIGLMAAVRPYAVPILGSPQRLQQVFWNLLHNAIKFTPKDGKVHVHLERRDSGVEVNFIDTGEGIAPEFLPNVFDRFQQADASITRRHGGLGLGLAIVKHLVELHGGKVWATSAGIGQGATFTVYFPLLAACSGPDNESLQPMAALAESQPLPNVSFASVHVLVVDDEIDGRLLVKRLLEMAGATVSVAGSASEAMEHILVKKPDLIICDIGMRGEDGYSFMRRLRTLERGQKSVLPAIALSAYARSEDRMEAIRSGFQSHLAKPVESAELLLLVSSLIGGKITNSHDAG